MEGLLGDYVRTLQPDRRHLVEQYRVVDVAHKVVGVGSVGARAWIVLLVGADDQDPCSFKPRKPRRRFSRRTPRPAATATMGVGSSRASG